MTQRRVGREAASATHGYADSSILLGLVQPAYKQSHMPARLLSIQMHDTALRQDSDNHATSNSQSNTVMPRQTSPP